MLFVRLLEGRTLAVHSDGLTTVHDLQLRLEEIAAIPPQHQRLTCDSKDLRVSDPLLPRLGCTLHLHLRLNGGGGDGDQPDWTERGKVSTTSKKRGPDARAPDWHGDAAKYAAKMEHDKRERGELVVALGPFCVPCGKRFAKQTVYDAHLSGSKHLKALERLGRTEEAMVCRLDVEAKRRKMEQLEAARAAERDPAARQAVPQQEDEDVEKRRLEREEKLRQRALLPMPKTVAATSVYQDADQDAAEDSAKPPMAPEVVKQTQPEPEALAAAAAGVESSYGRGMQDAAQRQNRFTSSEKANLHRSLAVPKPDWFGSGIHAEAAEPSFPEPMKAPDGANSSSWPTTS